MGRWIFQDIVDLENKFLYGSDEPLSEKMKKYNAALLACVKPEIYTQYFLWQCDIYVDVTKIEVMVADVYGISVRTIDKWIIKYKGPNQMLV